MIFVAAALVLNIAVLVPVIWSLMGTSPGVEAAFGPVTPARGILVSVYAAILVLSLVGLLAIAWVGEAAFPYIVTLLSLQIVYKLITIPVVGLGNPVVISNAAIAAFHAAVVFVVLTRQS